jgi:hypothetical protein
MSEHTRLSEVNVHPSLSCNHFVRLWQGGIRRKQTCLVLDLDSWFWDVLKETERALK